MKPVDFESEYRACIEQSRNSLRILDEARLRTSFAPFLAELAARGSDAQQLDLALIARKICYTLCALPARLPKECAQLPLLDIDSLTHPQLVEELKRFQDSDWATPALRASRSNPALFAARAYAGAIEARTRGPLFLCSFMIGEGLNDESKLGVFNQLPPDSLLWSPQKELAALAPLDWKRGRILSLSSPGLEA